MYVGRRGRDMRTDFARLANVLALVAATGGSVALPVWLLSGGDNPSRPVRAAAPAGLTVVRAAAPPRPARHPQVAPREPAAPARTVFRALVPVLTPPRPAPRP